MLFRSSSAIKPIDRDPPPKTLEKKDLISTREENKENKETKPERPLSRFDINGRADNDRREKPRERSRDRGYSRRDSRDRGHGGSRGRLRRSRSRDRDTRRRDDRPYDDRDRDRRTARDGRDIRERDARDTKRESRFDDRTTRRRSSRSPPRSPHRDPPPPNESISISKPIPPIDPSRDPVLGENAASQRRFIDREAEEKKLIEIRTREAEAKAFLQQREEAKAKGLPMPGYDDARSSRDRQGSGTPGLVRDPRDHRRESWRGGAQPKRGGDGFATPGPRDMDRRPSMVERPPSRGPFPMSREETPIPTGPRAHSRQREALLEIARRSPLHVGDRHMDHNGNPVSRASPVLTRDAKARAQTPEQGSAMRRHVRKDSTEAGEIVPGAPPDLITGDGTSDRRRPRSRSRDRRREERREVEKSRADSRERRRRDERADKRDDRRDSGRDYTRDRRDDRDRRPRSRSRDRYRRDRSRSRDRRPRDSGRSFGGRR